MEVAELNDARRDDQNISSTKTIMSYDRVSQLNDEMVYLLRNFHDVGENEQLSGVIRSKLP